VVLSNDEVWLTGLLGGREERRESDREKEMKKKVKDKENRRECRGGEREGQAAIWLCEQATNTVQFKDEVYGTTHGRNQHLSNLSQTSGNL